MSNKCGKYDGELRSNLNCAVQAAEQLNRRDENGRDGGRCCERLTRTRSSGTLAGSEPLLAPASRPPGRQPFRPLVCAAVSPAIVRSRITSREFGEGREHLACHSPVTCSAIKCPRCPLALYSRIPSRPLSPARAAFFARVVTQQRLRSESRSG